MDLQNADFQNALKKYRDAAVDAAKVRKQCVVDERKVRKLLAIDAMDLVAHNVVNPLTNRPHSWDSAQKQVRDSERGDELKTNLSELEYMAELATAEANIAWAELLWFVNTSHAH